MRLRGAGGSSRISREGEDETFPIIHVAVVINEPLVLEAIAHKNDRLSNPMFCFHISNYPIPTLDEISRNRVCSVASEHDTNEFGFLGYSKSVTNSHSRDSSSMR